MYFPSPPIPSPHINPCSVLLAFPQVFFSEKMTSLEISDMYFVKFDVFGQYLNNIWSMFVQQVSVQVYMSPINDDPHPLAAICICHGTK